MDYCVTATETPLKELTGLKVALVHDYLNQFGGAERVLEVLHEMFPQAPIFTLVYDQKVLPQYRDWDIRPSLLQHFPGAKQKYKYYLCSFPFVVKTFNVKNFDLVFSVSHAWVKGVQTSSVPHISYCLTPIRYAWDLYEDYLRHEYIPFPVKKVLPLLAWSLRKWDKRQAEKVDHFIAISETVRNRIDKFYGRSSPIIYPPVDTSFYRIDNTVQREDFYLTVSRMKAYKRIDLIVQAFNVLGYPLKVVGNGPEFNKLKAQARENITFLPNLSDQEVLSLYQRAKGFVYAAVEDFGLVLTEAQATGLPVIAYSEGGAREIVQEGASGTFFHERDVAHIVEALERFEEMSFDPEKVREASLRFDREIFKKEIIAFITDNILVKK